MDKCSCSGLHQVTGHFITKDWSLNSKVLATRVTEFRHTGSNIAYEISKVKDEFKVNGCSALVTDNAGNMIVAAKELSVPHVSCFSHTLQLSIEDGLKLNQIARVLGAARKLVAHFSHSVVATNALLAKQNDTSKPLKLVQDVPTRWNSSYFMMERLLKLRIAVYSVIFDDGVTKPGDHVKLDLKDSFWKVMEEIVPILEPLADITELLGKADVPTGSGVYILLYNVFNSVISPHQDDSGVVKDLKQKISEGLKRRFKLNDQGKPTDDVLASPLLLSTALDPRYKSILRREILAENQVGAFDLILTDMMESLPVAEVKQEPQPDENPPKKGKFLEILQGEVAGNDATGDERTAQNELEDYLGEIVRVSDPLQWWKINEGRFPRLGKLAQIYLAVPATSVPSERTFSVAGQTVSKLRASLDSDSVDQIIFLNKNMKNSIKRELQQIKCSVSANGSNDCGETMNEIPLIEPVVAYETELPQVKKE